MAEHSPMQIARKHETVIRRIADLEKERNRLEAEYDRLMAEAGQRVADHVAHLRERNQATSA